MAFGELTYE